MVITEFARLPALLHASGNRNEKNSSAVFSVFLSQHHNFIPDILFSLFSFLFASNLNEASSRHRMARYRESFVNNSRHHETITIDEAGSFRD